MSASQAELFIVIVHISPIEAQALSKNISCLSKTLAILGSIFEHNDMAEAQNSEYNQDAIFREIFLVDVYQQNPVPSGEFKLWICSISWRRLLSEDLTIQIPTQQQQNIYRRSIEEDTVG